MGRLWRGRWGSGEPSEGSKNEALLEGTRHDPFLGACLRFRPSRFPPHAPPAAPGDPQRSFTVRRPDYFRYEALKAAWISGHRSFTQQEYQRAMTAIAKACGV